MIHEIQMTVPQTPSTLGQIIPTNSIFKKGEHEWMAQLIAWYLVAECNDTFQLIEDPHLIFSWIAHSLEDTPQRKMLEIMVALKGGDNAVYIIKSTLPEVLPHLATAQAAAAFSKAWDRALNPSRKESQP